MKTISKENLQEFINKYHYFHDSFITNIYYDILKSQIELTMDVFWIGNEVESTHGTKIKMIFNKVERYSSKEVFSWEYINHAFLSYINLKNKEYLCFATDENNPFVYVVCEEIMYEEL